jgi:membrane protein
MSRTEIDDGAALSRQSERVPLWSIGLGALLVATGFGRRSNAAPDGHGTGDGLPSGVRGRSATTPSEIPASGWKDIIWRVYAGISEERILANAAAVTFYTLLALFPGIVALVSIYGFVADPMTIAGHLAAMSDILPGGAVDVIGEQVNRIAAQGAATLGVSFALSLVVSLWSANGGMKGLIDALNIVYEESEKRSFILRTAISLLFTMGMILFLAIALSAVVALPIALQFLPDVAGSILALARWPVLLVLVGAALTLLYRYGPSRTKPRWRWVTWGSAFAALAWLATSGLFSWYVANFGTFNETYGSLGAVIGFMTWIWLSAIVILIGAKLNAEMEHQTVRESTAGAPKPLGSRGARMADTIGRSRS